MLWQMSLVGLGAGLTSGLFGVGGGIVIVPALMILWGIEAHKAIGVSLAVILPTAAVGMWRHWQAGNVDFRLALLLVMGSVVGGYIGAGLATQLPADTLKRIFGGFLILIGLKLFFGWFER